MELNGPPRREWILAQLRERRERQRAISLWCLAALAPALLARWLGLPCPLRRAALWLALAGAALGLYKSLRNWRCPACDRYLGKSLGHKACPHCGADFTGG